MKKILFLLLLTTSIYAQNPTKFEKIKVTANVNSTTATKVNVQEVDGTVNTKPLSDFMQLSDIAGKENQFNKDNGILTASSITYPTSGAVKSQLDLKANIASPTFTGTPTAPTATLGTNTTQLATTAFVTNTVSVNGHWTKTGNDIQNNNTGNVGVGTLSNPSLSKFFINYPLANPNTESAFSIVRGEQLFFLDMLTFLM